MYKKIARFTLLVLIVAVLFTGIAIQESGVYAITDNGIRSISEIEVPDYPVTLDVKESNDGIRLRYKLFDAIPIRDVECDMRERYVYLGGKPLGISVKSNGLVISSKINVITEKGSVCPLEDCDIESGDILLRIDGVGVNTYEDVERIIDGKNTVTLTVMRDKTVTDYLVETATDVLSGKQKLGLWLKDGISGIGTLTYVDCESGRYGALGHPISEGENDLNSGSIYNAVIYGYIKGERGKAGELSGSFDRSSQSIGMVDKNNDFGIFGSYGGDTSDMLKVKLGNRTHAKSGKAHIYTTIDGNTPKMYEIEIIKCVSQAKPQNKGMVIRVTDSELLARTGGILQGMSGSPIIQDDRLIGAVTHVFVNDPTKGYGMYSEWMVEN